jgi:hypothetical protein
MRWSACTPQEDSWYSFLLEAQSTPWPQGGWKNYCSYKTEIYIYIYINNSFLNKDLRYIEMSLFKLELIIISSLIVSWNEWLDEVLTVFC